MTKSNFLRQLNEDNQPINKVFVFAIKHPTFTNQMKMNNEYKKLTKEAVS